MSFHNEESINKGQLSKKKSAIYDSKLTDLKIYPNVKYATIICSKLTHLDIDSVLIKLILLKSNLKSISLPSSLLYLTISGSIDIEFNVNLRCAKIYQNKAITSINNLYLDILHVANCGNLIQIRSHVNKLYVRKCINLNLEYSHKIQNLNTDKQLNYNGIITFENNRSKILTISNVSQLYIFNCFNLTQLHVNETGYLQIEYCPKLWGVFGNIYTGYVRESDNIIKLPNFVHYISKRYPQRRHSSDMVAFQRSYRKYLFRRNINYLNYLAQKLKYFPIEIAQIIIEYIYYL